MNDLTGILSAIEQGDPHAAEQLLPLVYDELRKLAAQKLAQEKPGQTLQATALVHEAYLRLVGGEPEAHWNSRGHFVAAAAEAMRRILVENARRKKAEKHGGKRQRIYRSRADPVTRADPGAVLDLDEVLTRRAGVCGALESGTDSFLGYSVQTSPGVWALTVATAGLTRRTYTLFARAEDRSGVFGDPLAIADTVS
jgi:RNA polymerase sigma factor (TIGR02999 family)